MKEITKTATIITGIAAIIVGLLLIFSPETGLELLSILLPAASMALRA